MLEGVAARRRGGGPCDIGEVVEVERKVKIEEGGGRREERREGGKKISRDANSFRG